MGSSPKTPVDRRAEVIALNNELREMPERRVFALMQSLDLSFYIYEHNFRELVHHMDYMRDKIQNHEFLHVDARDEFDAVSAELSRLIQNHVAAVVALFQHTGYIHSHNFKKGEFSEYQAKKDEFQADPVVAFVHCVRNLVTHGEVLPTTFQMKFGKDTGNSYYLLVRREYLREQKTWFKDAKAYLASVGENDVDISDVMTSYDATVRQFFDWFGRRVAETRSEDIARYKAKETLYFLLFIEDHLDSWFENPRPDWAVSSRERDVFHGLFNQRQFEELERLPAGSLARADRATQLASQMLGVAVPNQIQNKIRRAYTDPNFFKFDMKNARTIEEWTEEEGQPDA